MFEESSEESSGAPDGAPGASGSADAAVAQAVASAVRAGGPQLASDPRRVQGMVNDELGAQSRTRRAEVDAVVLAAEEAIPDDLMSGRIDVDEALQRLHGRGLDGGVALFAVEVWRYALGMLGDHSVPPTLSNSLEATSQPAVTDPTPPSLTESEPDATVVVLDEPAGEVRPAGWAPPIVNGDEHADAGVDSERSRSWWIVGSAAALVVALVVALIVVVAGGDDESDVAGATTLPATTNVPGTTTPPEQYELLFPSEDTALGELERSWAIADDTVEAALMFENPTDVAITGTHYEVVPLSMAPNAAAITSYDEFTVVRDAGPQGFRRAVEQAAEPVAEYLVLAWDLVVEPGDYEFIFYDVAVPATPITPSTLETWKDDQIEAAAQFATERDTPPSLVIATPNGTVFPTQRVEITGTTDPGATLTLSGNPVTVNPDGTWIMSGDVVPGPSTLDFVATNRYGTAVTVSISIVVDIPVDPGPGDDTNRTTTTNLDTTGKNPTTTTTPKNNDPIRNTTTTTQPQPPPTTTTQPPPPPPISVSIQGPGTVTVGCFYTWTLVASGFTPTSITWTGGGNSGSGTTYTVAFTAAGSGTIYATATASDGRRTNASRYVNVQPPAPGTSGC
jgi:hypothetical protein